MKTKGLKFKNILLALLFICINASQSFAGTIQIMPHGDAYDKAQCDVQINFETDGRKIDLKAKYEIEKYIQRENKILISRVYSWGGVGEMLHCLKIRDGQYQNIFSQLKQMLPEKSSAAIVIKNNATLEVFSNASIRN